MEKILDFEDVIFSMAFDKRRFDYSSLLDSPSIHFYIKKFLKQTIKNFRKLFNTISNIGQSKPKINSAATKLENKPDEFISEAERIRRK